MCPLPNDQPSNSTTSYPFSAKRMSRGNMVWRWFQTGLVLLPPIPANKQLFHGVQSLLAHVEDILIRNTSSHLKLRKAVHQGQAAVQNPQKFHQKLGPENHRKKIKNGVYLSRKTLDFTAAIAQGSADVAPAVHPLWCPPWCICLELWFTEHQKKGARNGG